MRHRFHSICPYFAMFPEAFAEGWIQRLTRVGDVVLDPFSGRGTTALSAILMGRKAIATDVNPVAYCLTLAKTNAPPRDLVVARLSELESGFDRRSWWRSARSASPFFQHAFHTKTLEQLLYLRARLTWKERTDDTMIAAVLLGALHGEVNKVGSYLSNQMPRTISTKPDYSVRFWKERKMDAPERDVFRVLENRIEFRYQTGCPVGECLTFNEDVRKLPRYRRQFPGPVRTVITSPPYLDVTSFEEDQWLRIWFLGGAPHPTTKCFSMDDRHGSANSYWRFMADMWRSLGQMLQSGSNVIVRIGCRRTDPEQLAKQLAAVSRFSKMKSELISTEITTIRNGQTRTFVKNSVGCRWEVDCHVRLT